MLASVFWKKHQKGKRKRRKKGGERGKENEFKKSLNNRRMNKR
jgi:hypothetical protein